MSDPGVTSREACSEGAEVFDGFPYLVTRVVPALHHIILLPRGWDIEHLTAFARKQIQANRLPSCLVLAGDTCVYFREDGTGCRSDDVPCGASIVAEKLAPVELVPDSCELAIRRMELILREEAQCLGEGVTLIMGDLTKGGRMPTAEEEERLSGTHFGGAPRGLLPCLHCGEWRGECFDTLWRNLVVRVHCRCENDNRCAACDGLLSERKLNSNYFEPEDGQIWHVPGFCALRHRCDGAREGLDTDLH